MSALFFDGGDVVREADAVSYGWNECIVLTSNSSNLHVISLVQLVDAVIFADENRVTNIGNRLFGWTDISRCFDQLWQI